MDVAGLGRVAEAIRAQSRRNAAVRRAAARLLYDITVVLFGLRPSFLLDYAPVPLEPCVAVAREAAAAASTSVVVLTLDGCHLVGRLDRLLHHLTALVGGTAGRTQAQAGPPEGSGATATAADRSGPGAAEEEPGETRELCGDLTAEPPAAMATGTSTCLSPGRSAAGSAPPVSPLGQEPRCCFIAFHNGREEEQRAQPGRGQAEHRGGPHLLSPGEVQATVAKLAPLLEALQRAASAAPGAAAVHTLRLDDLPGLPLQPTLQGMLLGYPVVYDIGSREEADAASRCLATQGLVLHRMPAPPAGELAAQVRQLTTPSDAGGGGGRSGRGRAAAAAAAVGEQKGAQLPERDLRSLCAFSAPRTLAAQEPLVAAVRKWQRQMKAALAATAVGVAAGTAAAAAEAGDAGGEDRRDAAWWEWWYEMEVEEHLTPCVVL